MEPPPDPPRIAAFLMAAWKGLVGLEEAIQGLDGSEAEAARAALARRGGKLAESAREFGFPQLAQLASSMERLARALPPEDHGSMPDVRQLLTDTLTVLPMVLDNIAAEASEDIPQLPGLQWRYDVEVPAAEELDAQRRRSEAPGEVDAELERLRRDDAELVSFFVVEAREHLHGMAEGLADLRAAGVPADETLNDFFRHAHTIKGAAYTVGAQAAGDLAHGLEDLWVSIRRGDRALSREILKVADRSIVVLRQMVDRLDGRTETAVQHRYAEMIGALGALRRDGEEADADSRDADRAREAEEPAQRPAERLRAADSAPPVSVPALSLAAEDLHESRDELGSRYTLRVDLERLEKVLDLAGEVTVAHGASVRGLSRLENVHRQLDDCKRRMVRTVATFQERHLNPVLEVEPPRPGPSETRETAESRGTEPDGTEPDDAEAPARRTVAEQFAELEFDRYDDFNILARRIGELSSDLSEIHQELEQVLADARRGALQVQGLTRRLRVGMGRVRMVPVGRLFARFSRLARKAADESGKEIEVELEGEQVELDNAVVERLAEPLTHLVQNAVHHGLEPPDARRAAGKEPRGTLRLAARARGRRVRLEVSDDGAGIDVRKIRRQAVELGLKTAEQVAALSDEEALRLIYLPGLTTSTRVTTAVGRGIGMDAARHSVHRMGGDIRIEHEPGAGTRFTLELPVSLLVTEALVVRVGESAFALPMPQVEKLVHLFEDTLRSEIPPDNLRRAEEVALIDGRRLPVTRLAERLGLASEGAPEEVPGLLAVAVVVRTRAPSALIVDEVLGIEELVIKPLGPFFEGSRPFGGAGLDTRGHVLLMLDAAALTADDDGPWERPPTPPLALPEPPPRVLLVDDSLSVRRVIGRALQKQGYEVFTARDGAEALELLLDLPFAAVITDLEMPRMSGYELIDDLRTRASTRDTPVWVITTRAGARHAELARELGAVGYLAKPVDTDLLLRELESVIHGSDADLGSDEP